MMLLETLSQFVFHKQDMPSEAIYLAKRSMIDYVGVLLYGSKEDIITKLKGMARANGKATIAGLGSGFSPREAALLNGIAGHILDYDDTSFSTMGHSTAVVLPAVMALAEEKHASGKELLRAYLLGIEVAGKLGCISVKDIHKRGWHATSVLGVIGAAAGCGVVLELSASQLQTCLSIAASQSAGIRANFGTNTKAVHVGKAAEGGVLAAILAACGLSASSKALEGKEGFFPLFTGRDCTAEQRQELQDTLGNPFDICSPGFMLKRYPSCTSNHRALDAMLDLLRDHEDLNPLNIEEIKVGISSAALRELVSPIPRTADEARFSIGFHLALALLRIPITPQAYCPEVVLDEEVQQMIRRIEIYHEPEFDHGIGVGPQRVSVVTCDGKQYAVQRHYAVGHPADPLSDDALKEKFFHCAVPAAGERKANLLYQALSNLEKIDDISETLGYIG